MARIHDCVNQSPKSHEHCHGISQGARPSEVPAVVPVSGLLLTDLHNHGLLLLYQYETKQGPTSVASSQHHGMSAFILLAVPNRNEIDWVEFNVP